MSALDDLIARDSGGASQSSLDAIIARDAGGSAPAGPVQPAAPGQSPGMLASFGAGLGHGVGSTALGLQQLLGHGAQAIGLNNVGGWLMNDADHGLKSLDAQYAPYSEANPITAGTGNIGGQIAGTAATMLAGPEYAGLSLAGKLGLGAAQGAAGAAMMPVTQNPDQSFGAQKLAQMGIGAALGGATPLAAQGAAALGRGLLNAAKPVVQPMQFVGKGIAGGMAPADAAAAAANIRGARQFVPGSMPTTAQAAGTPYLVQTEKAAGNIPDFKTGFAQRAIDNNDARWNALNSVAQTPDALAAAQTARGAAATPLYEAAHQQTANVGKGFIGFAQRPAVQQAMQQADTLARNEGVRLTWPTPENRAISGQALDYTNRALGDMIGVAQRAGNNQQARALTDAQSYLKSWTQTYIPGVRQAAQTYAGMSVPVNTMEAGQQIANSLGTRAMNAGQVPEIQLSPYRTALTQAMKNAEFGIDANSHQTLQGIGQDLQRATVSNSIRSPGSDTAYNLGANGWLAKQLFGPTFQGASNVGKAVGAASAALLGHPYAAGGILMGGNKIGQLVGARLQSRLSDLLLNPNSILPYLDAHAASAAQPTQNALAQRLMQYGRPALVNGLGSSLIYGP